MPSPPDVTSHFFLQLAIVLVACIVVGRLLRLVGQTQVVADMVVGFLLGPTLLGYVAPAASGWLFPTTIDVGGQSTAHPGLAVLHAAGQIGLVFFMFMVGLTFDTRLFRRHLAPSMSVAGTGVGLPLLVGGVAGWLMVTEGDGLFTKDMAPWQGAVFIGAALCVTAFPMLARIIREHGLTGSPIGTIALASAALEDAFAWIMLAIVVSTITEDTLMVAVALMGAVVYVVFLVALRRVFPVLRRWVVRGRTAEEQKSQAFTVVVVLLLTCAWFTELIGVYAVFGAFALGVAVPRDRLPEEIIRRLEPITCCVLLPMFFVYVGLRTRLEVLLEPTTIALTIVVLLLAILTKGGACLVVSRVFRLSWRDGLRLSALMNARGLMELILLDIGLSAGVITDRLYTVLAVMTVVTTLAVAPVFQLANRFRDTADRSTRQVAAVRGGLAADRTQT